MSQYNPNKHQRRSIRLKGYDYAQAGLYFITICIKNRVCLLGHIKNGIMQLNHLGNIVNQEWQNTAKLRKNCSLGAYIVMPNHFHAILSIDYAVKETKNMGTFQSPSQTIGAIIRGFKGATTKQIKEAIRSKGVSLDGKGGSKGVSQYAPTAPTAPTDSKGVSQYAPTIWQRNYYEHIIKDEQAYQNIENYIINNPKKWDEDKFYQK